MLDEIFSEYGEVANVYVPVDLQHGCKPLGIGFVRFTTLRSATKAAEAMNGADLGGERGITVQVVAQKRYWSQDESTETGKKRK